MSANGRATAGFQVLALRDGERRPWPETVVGEEPLEIRVATPSTEATRVSVTMRTPGNDFELAAGFLLAEGVITDPAMLRSVRYCVELEEQRYNVVTVDLDPRGEPGALADLDAHRRAFTVSSSCGICGTASIEQLEQRCAVLGEGPLVDASILLELPEALRAHQELFDRTGGIHAAGLFRPDGELLAVREDIGRHNAVDKLLGWALLNDVLPLSEAILVVSGRVSFEIVQKAAVGRIPIVVAVSAPSSLAVETARRLSMTLVAFARQSRANVYAGSERLREPAGIAKR